MRADAEPLPGMLGRHPAMRAVGRLVRRAAGSALPVVIVGETGTGKELVAQALHALSGCSERPLVDLNCAAVPEGLAEAELFGTERGAYTGAVIRPGLLELADGGTLFLDEAGSLSLALQAKLLRALEEREVRRVGGTTVRHARFRLVVALTEPLERLVQAGRVRLDFAYRIAGITIGLPPLRARGSDLTLLAEAFLVAAERNGRPPAVFAPEALAVLRRHNWPGNVRELKTLIERLALLVDGPVITAAHVRAELPRTADGTDAAALRAILDQQGWNLTKAALALRLPRSTLQDRLSRLGVVRPGG